MKCDNDILVDFSIDKITPWFPTGLILDLEELLERKVDVATKGIKKNGLKKKFCKRQYHYER